METGKTLDEITGAIVDAAVKLHQGLGPGLLESVYESLLAKELDRRGFRIDRQTPSSSTVFNSRKDSGSICLWRERLSWS